MVYTLNNAQDIIVFAPTNDAVAKIPKADLDGLPDDRPHRPSRSPTMWWARS